MVIRWVPAVSMIVTTPERAPVACGRKVTLIVQLARGASVLPQFVVIVKSSPLRLMLPIDSGPFPELNRTTACGRVEVPEVTPPKFRYPLLRNGLAAGR